MEFRLLSDHEDVATFPSSLHRSHRESAVVAPLIRGLNIRCSVGDLLPMDFACSA